ncbi:MAG TPA: FapA family protein [Candidatus Glassbacteria bacterium]|nr:FapA family protein [Candidatus Glassbacteria bacterium]
MPDKSDNFLDFIDKLDLDRLKYEISKELGEMPDDVSRAVDAVETHRVIVPPKIDVRVSADKMKAFLNVAQPGEPSPVTEDNLKDSLARHGIVKGIIHKNFDRILDEMLIGQEMLVAEGEPPKDGKDGLLRNLVDSKSTNPEDCIDPLGRVDFKKMRQGNIIEKGEVALEIIPPTSGVAGYNIKGEILPPKPGKEADAPISPDLAVNPDNPLQYIALKNGVLKRDFTIDEVNFINGHIDFSTGNIEYERSVVVKGDVKTGFYVHCGGDVEVRGCVEDAEVIAGGDVVVKQGFLGSDKGLIKGRNVTLGHVKQQKVYASADINLGGEAFHSYLQAQGYIKALGVRGIVIGGTLIAGKGIEISNAGNARQIRTVLAVALTEATLKDEDYLAGLKVKLEKTRKAVNMLEAVEKQHGLSIEKMETFVSLLGTKKYIEAEIDKTDKRIESDISRMISEEKPYIRVSRTMYPNTTVQIGRMKRVMTAELRNKRFCFLNNSIFIGT